MALWFCSSTILYMRFMVNSSLMVGWPLGVFWKLVVLSSIGSITQCCMFMSTDVSRTSDCVSGDMISRHKVRITWVNVHVTGDFPTTILALGSVALESMPSYGDWAALFHWISDVDQWIILLLTRSLHSPFYAHIFVPPCCLHFSLHHRLRSILHFWRCHSKESIKVSVLIRWLNFIVKILHHSRLTPPYTTTTNVDHLHCIFPTKNLSTWEKTPRQIAQQDQLGMICSIGKPRSWDLTNPPTRVGSSSWIFTSRPTTPLSPPRCTSRHASTTVTLIQMEVFA